MSVEQEERFLKDRAFFLKCAVVGYVLLLVGIYFLVAYSLPAANILGFDGVLLQLFALIFTILGFTYLVAMRTVALLITLVNLVHNILLRFGDILTIVEDLQTDEEKTGKRSRSQPAINRIREELKESVERRIKEAEGRLRGEWRFVVTVILAILAIFVTVSQFVVAK